MQQAIAQGLAQALARRAAGQAGQARRLIDARLAALAARPAPVGPAASAAPAPGPLAELLADHAQRARAAAALAAPAASTNELTVSAAEPEALAWFRDTWSRLSTAQRLAESQAHLPGNAGPLNAEHLAHRALLVMNEASPETLRHFLAQLDTLFWLDAVNRG